MKKCGGIPPAPKWVTFFFNPPQPIKTQHLGALKMVVVGISALKKFGTKHLGGQNISGVL